MTQILIEASDAWPITDSTGANTRVSFDGGAPYSVTITDPFTHKEEQRLAWYFEEHLYFPLVKQVQAREAAESIVPYGEQLFAQIFADRRAYARYIQSRNAGIQTLQFELVGPSAFHALHWEALKDPEVAHPFVLEATMVRKNMVPVPFEASVLLSPTINILVVTARPKGKHDPGYRTISLPLVEALRQANVPVQIEFVRPGTYTALEQHLARTTAQNGPGYYHVIHFDVHGAILTYDELCEGEPPSRYLGHNRPGVDRPDLLPYPGEKAFLLLQHEEKVQADPIEASELAQLLQPHQIPIVLLNACKSGKVPMEGPPQEVEEANAQDVVLQAAGPDMRESSLGQRLMQAGVQVVLAMSYSVTVSAAQRLMTSLYRRLFAGDDLATAMRVARNELAAHKERRAYFNAQIELEDWLLPIVYQNHPVQLSVRPFSSDEDQRDNQQQTPRYQEPPTTYDFVGRDLDVLEIERHLLTLHNILLIRGMGGAGKTTLLHHLATWWQTTHLVEHVFYFGYDARAWTLQELIHSIAEQLVGIESYQREFHPLPLNVQQDKLTTLLRDHRHLLILDNLESITGTQFAILPTLPLQEQELLHHFLIELAGGETLVLLGSRSEETWLSPGTFFKNHYILAGLDREAASTLTDLILVRHSATQYRSDDNLQSLVNLLGGFPLALQIALANLAHHTPTKVLSALQVGSTALDATEGSDKTQSILRCIDYSYRNLSDEAQRLLLCLAPFTTVFDTDLLEAYTKQLNASPLLATQPFEQWAEILHEAQEWGLLTPDVNLPSFLHLQPVLPYFLRTCLRAPEQQERRVSIYTAFQLLYDQVGYEYYYSYLQAKEPQRRMAGQIFIQLEYENMVAALYVAIAMRTSIIDPFRALDGYLRIGQEPQRGLALAQMVLSGLQTYSAEQLAGPFAGELETVLGRVASFLLDLKQYAASKQIYLQVLAMLKKQITDTEPESKQQLAAIYHQLGRVAQEQRQWRQAEQYYQEALRLKEEFDDRYEQATIYHQLGIVAEEQRQWAQAEQYYQQALRICEEFGDHPRKANIYHQLGTVALNQQQWRQAEQYYQQALRLKEESGDRYSQASTYNNLGGMALNQQQWAQAEQYYQQALRIYEESGDRYSQASAYYNLGIVAQEQRQWLQAEQYYQQALMIFAESQDEYHRRIVLNRLGRMWRVSGEKGLLATVAGIMGWAFYNGPKGRDRKGPRLK